MARRKVDKTIEHRITFGDLERREFKQSMDAYQRNMNLQAGINGGRAVLYAGVAAGIGAVGYLGVKLYAAIQENSGTIEESVEELWNKLNGTKTETDPETGETTTVPNTVQSPTDTGEISNPAAGIPVIGGLFYTGMKIGQISFLGAQRGGAGPLSWLLR